MEKAGVIAIRDMYKAKKLPMRIVCDNMEIFYDNIKDQNSSIDIIWDDANEIFYAYRANLQPTLQKRYPVELTATTYENIQFIMVYLDPESAFDYIKTKVKNAEQKEVAKQIISNGVYQDRSIDYIREHPKA